jgi:hypothetical protein
MDTQLFTFDYTAGRKSIVATNGPECIKHF